MRGTSPGYRGAVARRIILGLALTLALAALSPASGRARRARAPAHPERTQFVVVSMDATPGAGPVETEFLLRVQEAFARYPSADGRPSSFTLFINAGFLQLDPSARRHARDADAAPFRGTLPRNQPSIEYARDLEELARRVENVRTIQQRGVELGSHGVRHVDGRDWDQEAWTRELDDHSRILALHELAPPVGMRAPFLGANAEYFRELQERRFRYDTSRVLSRGPRWPARVRRPDGSDSLVWEFALPRVELSGGRHSVFFDLTLRNRHHVGDEEYEALARRLFERTYRGSRAPVLLSGHGNYMRPTLSLVRRVCGLPDVRCGTFAELADYMDAHPELAGAR